MLEPNIIFDTKIQSSMTFPEYVKRIKKYTFLKDEDFCSVVYFLSLICKKYRNINFTMRYKLFACAVLIYIKMYDDNFYTNIHYGQVFGINTTALNELEISFLSMLDWYAIVPVDQYEMNYEWLKNNNFDYQQLIENVWATKNQ